MKYKIGDKVKIREDLTVHGSFGYGWCFVDEMSEYKGKILTIDGYTYDNSYEVYENEWVWTDDMIEGLASEVKNKKNIKEKNMKDFRIKDYKVYEDTALIVEFKDGTKEKAVCSTGDKFDLERGIEICVLKHIFGSDGYKSMLKTAMKQVKAVDKEKEDKKKLEESIANKKAKAARRKAKRLENKRNKRIEEIKEGFLAAMKEHETISIGCALEDVVDEFVDDLK